MRLAKFNPNHDKRGRFAKKPGGASSSEAKISPIGKPLGDMFSEEIESRVLGHIPYDKRSVDQDFFRAVRDLGNLIGAGPKADNYPKLAVRFVENRQTTAIMSLVCSTDGGGDFSCAPKSIQFNIANMDSVPNHGKYRGMIYHEIGHAIDRWMSKNNSRAIGTFTSTEWDSPDIDELRQAIVDAPTTQIYTEIMDALRIEQAKVSEVVNGKLTPVGHRDATNAIFYTTESREVFARAFAQWAAIKIGDQEALDWMATGAPGKPNPDYYLEVYNKKTKKTTPVTMFFHWTPEEFEPIDRAMTKLLRSRGMIA